MACDEMVEFRGDKFAVFRIGDMAEISIGCVHLLTLGADATKTEIQASLIGYYAGIEIAQQIHAIEQETA